MEVFSQLRPEEMRPCYGPFHKGKYLPVDEFSTRGQNPRPHPRCRLCRAYLARMEYAKTTGGGMVDAEKIKPFLGTLKARLGFAVLHRLGINISVMYGVLGGERLRVRRKTAARILTLYALVTEIEQELGGSVVEDDVDRRREIERRALTALTGWDADEAMARAEDMARQRTVLRAEEVDRALRVDERLKGLGRVA